jgi:hypothetical protein
MEALAGEIWKKGQAARSVSREADGELNIVLGDYQPDHGKGEAQPNDGASGLSGQPTPPAVPASAGATSA